MSLRGNPDHICTRRNRNFQALQTICLGIISFETTWHTASQSSMAQVNMCVGGGLMGGWIHDRCNTCVGMIGFVVSCVNGHVWVHIRCIR